MISQLNDLQIAKCSKSVYNKKKNVLSVAPILYFIFRSIEGLNAQVYK